MSENPNKIKRLQLENFTCFERVDLEFSPGVNVFIGENGTGKTHLLKAAYSLGKYNYGNEFTFPPQYEEDWKPEDLLDVFKVSSRTNLLRSNLNSKMFSVFVERTGKPKVGYGTPDYSNKYLFIPVVEMLSWQKGFQSLYQKREVSFDRTYYDLAVSLGLGILKNTALEEAKTLAAAIREAIKAEVFQRDERFYFKFDDLDAELEAPVVAQGINKLGQLYYLILNGSLTKDTILFWDEPETGLNPKYIKVVAQFLQTLTNAGVQIFVATHDYLLTHYLSLAAEYREQTQAPDMKFFALYKGKNGTEIETGATLAEIQNDAILEEYAAYYDLENEYFKQTVIGPRI